METTQGAPANTEKTEAQKPATGSKPLPSTEEDFHTRPSRTQSSGFRIGVVMILGAAAGIMWQQRDPSLRAAVSRLRRNR